ncbi:hypothetical protein G7Y89_g973 [Cudoniella acicularis]|uniref:Uncharacterized protein n=1 Tax=Cudoniella acicularis TaxID=354080 RepID=A0A8H4RXX6_9HELO|nr:hypothetical protein G7Y89_g973 [Cudoniella acicularis]
MDNSTLLQAPDTWHSLILTSPILLAILCTLLSTILFYSTPHLIAPLKSIHADIKDILQVKKDVHSLRQEIEKLVLDLEEMRERDSEEKLHLIGSMKDLACVIWRSERVIRNKKGYALDRASDF